MEGNLPRDLEDVQAGALLKAYYVLRGISSYELMMWVVTPVNGQLRLILVLAKKAGKLRTAYNLGK
ncbi:hypothetical protein RvY_13558 [Ramazzottius varieornatus]|uniref:Uncharacterized protein n=1 Tax=Ramazzottius varieornatus TaxID=947166 RepID=A0A1D1VQG2_RAMVA|nr:hypothetical protein RvY_13558 [Ramazzottius varieornatus]